MSVLQITCLYLSSSFDCEVLGAGRNAPSFACLTKARGLLGAISHEYLLSEDMQTGCVGV